MSNVTRTDARPNERGAISIKALLALVLAGVAIFLVIKIAPVYIQQQQLIHDVDELARAASLRGYKEERISKDIKRIRDEYNLPENGINFHSRDKDLQIAVGYQKDIDLLVTNYAWKVDYTRTCSEGNCR
jgi:hypothetical protein